jgi:hypothetical protein
MHTQPNSMKTYLIILCDKSVSSRPLKIETRVTPQASPKDFDAHVTVHR